MLKIVYKLHDLCFSDLMQVYAEGNRENGAIQHPEASEKEQLLLAEQDFYAYLQEFFRDNRSFYALWASGGRYVAALRIEPYADGLLLEALETAPEARGRGYAKALVRETLAYLDSNADIPVYSHVRKRNFASLAVHQACGFERIQEHAVLIDGSVMHNCCTFRYCRK